jgi:hypothetical protein
MAGPPELPESIIVGTFAGMRNNVAAERLQIADLESGVNVDIDDAGQARRRRGRTLKLAGDFHSVQTLKRGTLAVRDGTLGWVLPGYAFIAITTVGSKPVSAVQVGADVYFSSLDASGVIREDGTLGDWGVSASAPTWLSPVVAPTSTAGAIAGKLISPPPYASLIETYRGRNYLAVGKILWVTELYLYGWVDRTRGFLPFEHDITMLKAVNDGLFVGTTGGIYFIKGTFAEGMKLEPIVSSAALSQAVAVPTSKIHPQARSGPIPEGEGIAFLGADGFFVGFDGGQLYNLTQDRMVFPEMVNAAVLYREQDGVNQLVAAADSRGEPTASARIGDYVDAEIRRFQGG